MTSPAPLPIDRPALGIGFILLSMAAISLNDMLIKLLSGGYPLHQMVFVRSAIGIMFSVILIQVEGGFGILKTRRPFLHILRGLLIVTANMCFFAALAALSLAEATALFFVAPLLITVLSVPLLGEKIGWLRSSAVVVGFLGVLVMVRPWESGAAREVSLWVILLPIAGALTYALNQILTRKLGAASKASAMAAYTQFMFILVSSGFFLIAGDGRFVEGVDNESMRFLLRAWVWPEGDDIYLFAGLGLSAAIVGYGLSQAYRVADVATIAPFEYVGLPLAVIWGWLIWGDLPDLYVSIGMALIAGAGLFVFLREWWKKRPLTRVRSRAEPQNSR